ncbi:hypothetical protein Ddye_026490, partial [Dipteronia dyeriana]
MNSNPETKTSLMKNKRNLIVTTLDLATLKEIANQTVNLLGDLETRHLLVINSDVIAKISLKDLETHLPLFVNCDPELEAVPEDIKTKHSL